ncbi:hypothetical protein I4U23_002849 [Adineta vaga]|nr:hypothetical protein I4U23_002849 [Adineta vaga]
MSAYSRDNESSSLPPPGFSGDKIATKRVQLIDLLEKVIDKCQHEPQFIENRSKQTDLLVKIAEFTLLSSPVSPSDKQDFLNNLFTIGQDLFNDENQSNDEEIGLRITTDSSPNEVKETTTTTTPLLPSTPPKNHDDDGNFSLDDLANEYLRNDPSPPSSNEKEKIRSESNEPDPTLDNIIKTSISSAPMTNILSKLMFSTVTNEPLSTKPQIESILFPNLLSLHNDEDCMWKDQSSPLGQLFCSKTNGTKTKVTKRVSTCLLDRSLYERLTRLIILLPKECIRTSSQQMSVRSNNGQQYRSQRPNNDNRRPSNRPSFQQNSSQIYNNQRFPTNQNVRHHMNPTYQNQQNNAGGYFVDRRSQQQRQQQQQQQQPQQHYRYPQSPSSFAPHPNDYQQKGSGPKHNFHAGGQQQQQQKKNPSTNNNQQGSNQHPQQQQRGPKKGSGGNKFNNEKSGVPGSGPSLNPK